MFWMRASILYLFFSCLYFPVLSQPFNCDGRVILSAVQSNTTTYSIDFGFGFVYFNPVSVYLNESFDALGFNSKDNYIYGVQKSTNSIVRLRKDGSYEMLGSIAPISALNSYAGDCSPDGFYLCHDNELDQILVFNVLDDFELVEQVDLFWNPFSLNSGPFTTRIDDFAIDPNNPTVAYAFQGNYIHDDFKPATTRGYLLKINVDLNDPDVGMVTPITSIPSDVILQLGGLFFNKEGGLFGYGPYTIGPFAQNKLISINPFTGDTEVKGVGGPQASISDGCSCPYSLSFEKDALPRGVTCSNSELTFTLTIGNRSNENLPNLTLTDTIPEGMIIKAISENFNGTIAAGTGVGTRFITINNLDVAAKEIIAINIEAEIEDIPIGFLPSQAHLSNLPSLFGGFRISDDPQTTGFIGDPTTISSGAQKIDNVELRIIPPSNCLDANDAQVHISSPLLLANQPYQIKMINKSWEVFNFNILVDNDQSFVLDSLVPGEYQLVEVTPENSRCSFAWKDTIILINPPNEQLQVNVESNSPICEGSSLELSGTISPDGMIAWTGPNGFNSSNLNSIVDVATPEQSGTFEMIATYGACEQIRTIEVLVAPDIEASISGKLDYCEREKMQLEAVGNGDLQGFQWSRPDNVTSTKQQVNILSMAPVYEGIYQVIIDNGYCLDTASTSISVLPSPTIALPEIIETDFCDPVKLSPVITGDSDVTYSWIPNEGLSCYDCDTPELLVPFLPKYGLTVVNEHSCSDTAAIEVALSKEKLIYIPNAFSPNFDGVNDYFQLFPSCGVSGIKNLKIFNRWGAVVYSKSRINQYAPQAFWNGLINGESGTSGVYIWQVEIDLVDGTTQKLFGDVSLLK